MSAARASCFCAISKIGSKRAMEVSRALDSFHRLSTVGDLVLIRWLRRIDDIFRRHTDSRAIKFDKDTRSRSKKGRGGH